MIISFLASHGGSSARAIIDEILHQRIKAKVGILITNNRDSRIFAWCLENKINVRHISAKTHRGEENADEAISTVLQNENTDLVICSGYMKKIIGNTLNDFSDKILNIHPSLLPKHGGKGMYGDHVHEAVLANKDQQSGATVHFVSEIYDQGRIIKQQKVNVSATETLASLRSKVQAIEPTLYIEAIQSLIKPT